MSLRAAKQDALVFQQIDVEESTDYSNGATTLRMFGVTEASYFGIKIMGY